VAVACVIVVVAAVLLALRGPSFSISVSPGTLTIPRGGSENVTISYSPEVPQNLSTNFETGSAWINVSPTDPPFTFTVNVSSNAITGEYTVTVEAIDGNTGARATATFRVVVT
jgi:hypothetical protein